jgi:hypothetical protein
MLFLLPLPRLGTSIEATIMPSPVLTLAPAAIAVGRPKFPQVDADFGCGLSQAVEAASLNR